MYANKKPKPDKDSIFCGDNPYGYKLNISHPVINKFYLQYKDEIGAGNYPLSDRERLEFEQRVFKWIENNNLKVCGGKLMRVKGESDKDESSVNNPQKKTSSKPKAWERD